MTSTMCTVTQCCSGSRPAIVTLLPTAVFQVKWIQWPLSSGLVKEENIWAAKVFMAKHSKKTQSPSSRNRHRTKHWITERLHFLDEFNDSPAVLMQQFAAYKKSCYTITAREFWYTSNCQQYNVDTELDMITWWRDSTSTNSSHMLHIIVCCS